MKHRNPAAVFFLPIITLGIYSLVWHVKTKNEMNRQGANIPTAWLLIIPFVSWYWLWKYSEGVEQVTGGQMSGVLAFVLLFLLGFIGMAILQSEFNKVGDAAAMTVPGGPSPIGMPGSQPLPDNSFGGPPTPPAPGTLPSVPGPAPVPPVMPGQPIPPSAPTPPAPTPPAVSPDNPSGPPQP